MGSENHAHGGEVLNVKQIIQHPMFDYSSIDFDYSILEIEGSLKFNENIQPIMLPNDKEQLQDGKNCSISGWGTTMVIKNNIWSIMFKKSARKNLNWITRKFIFRVSI